MLYIHRAQPSDSILSTRYICHNSRPRERDLKNVTRFRCKTRRISLWHDIFLNMSIINSAQVYSRQTKKFILFRGATIILISKIVKRVTRDIVRERLNDVETRVSSNLFYRDEFFLENVFFFEIVFVRIVKCLNFF